MGYSPRRPARLTLMHLMTRSHRRIGIGVINGSGAIVATVQSLVGVRNQFHLWMVARRQHGRAFEGGEAHSLRVAGAVA